MLRHLLWATDFSESAQAALEWAVALAKSLQARLTLLHIAEAEEKFNEQLAAEHRQALETLAEQLRQEGLSAETMVQAGPAAATIAEWARKLSADLVVLGAHGHSSFREKLLGSTTEQLLSLSPTPVLCVREKWTPQFRHFLVPSDLSDTALLALDFAVQLAQRMHTKVTLLHVVSPYEGSPEAWEELKREVAEELKRWSARTLEPSEMPLVEPKVRRYHHPGAAITEFAKEHGVDLIILPTHGRSALGRLLLGSVASHVVYYAPCPVISGKASAFQQVLQAATV